MDNFSRLPWITLQRDIQCFDLLPAHAEYRPPPLNLVVGDGPLFSNEYYRQWGPCQVTALDDLNVLGTTWVQLRWGQIVDHYMPGQVLVRRKRDRLQDLAQLRYPCQRVKEALWVHDDWSGNYFHWVTDVLPKLLAWLERGMPCRSVLLPNDLLHRSYVLESLEWLGFEPIAWTQARLQIDRLIVINATAPTGNFRAALLRRLGQHLRRSCHVQSPSEDSSVSFYISRADAPKRFLHNEAQLISSLAAHRVQVVQLQGKSLSEQVDLFRRCRLLVGLHGAGLTNMLWMPSGSHVLEVRRRGDTHNNCYYAMACALGHRYSYLLADDVRTMQDTHSAELHLDPGSLHQYLAAIMRDNKY